MKTFLVILILTGGRFAAACSLPLLLNGAAAWEAKFLAARPHPISFTKIPVTPASLYAAHRTGYLPERGNVWEVPPARGVVPLHGRKISKGNKDSFSKLLASDLQMTFNVAPREVIFACSKMDRDSDFWMDSDVVEGYSTLAALGFVFSSELWDADRNLIAGNFGIVSNGHVQGVSMFRDLSHPLATSGIGTLVAEAGFFYLWSQGVDVMDVEVAEIKTGRPKQGVDAMLPDDYFRWLSDRQKESFPIFRGEIGKPFDPIDSDFPSQFRAMKARESYFYPPRQ